MASIRTSYLHMPARIECRSKVLPTSRRMRMNDDYATLERAEALLRERGFLAAATGCKALMAELWEARVSDLAALILSAQQAMMEKEN